jgi:hypothetical protein
MFLMSEATLQHAPCMRGANYGAVERGGGEGPAYQVVHPLKEDDNGTKPSHHSLRDRFRANSAQIRLSRPDSGLGFGRFQIKVH